MVKCNQTEDICSIQLFRIPPHLFKVAYFVPSFFLNHLSYSILPCETNAGLRLDNISATVLRPSR